MSNKLRGITLIELMVVLVVLAILVSIAYPTYVDQVRRTRRADAMTALTEMANLQERYYTQKFEYATDITNLKRSSASPDGYYTLDIPSNSLNSYTVRASAIAPQDKDTNCTTMTMRSNGVKAPADCWKR